MWFSRQEYWSGLPFLFPGDLPDPGIEPWSPALQEDPLPLSHWIRPLGCQVTQLIPDGAKQRALSLNLAFTMRNKVSDYTKKLNVKCWDERLEFSNSPSNSPLLLSLTILLFFSHSVVSSSLQLHGLQHSRLPCPSPSPSACSNSCPLSRWCHPTISSSVVPFSSCPQSSQYQGLF